MLSRIGDLVVGRPWRIVAAAAVVVAVSAALGGRVTGYLKPFGFDDPSSESIAAAREIADMTGVDPDRSLVALVRLARPVGESASRADVDRVAGRIARDPDVGLRNSA